MKSALSKVLYNPWLIPSLGNQNYALHLGEKGPLVVRDPSLLHLSWFFHQFSEVSPLFQLISCLLASPGSLAFTYPNLVFQLCAYCPWFYIRWQTSPHCLCATVGNFQDHVLKFCSCEKNSVRFYKKSMTLFYLRIYLPLVILLCLPISTELPLFLWSL